MLGRRRRAQMSEARAFGKERAPDDAQRQARVAALQEANRGLHRVDVALGVGEEVRDRRRHGRASGRASCARRRSSSAMRSTSGAENSRRNNASEASACVTVSPSSAACRRKKPVRYAVAGYGVLSWVIGGVTSRTRMAEAA